jgi:hypothetical protein
MLLRVGQGTEEQLYTAATYIAVYAEDVTVENLGCGTEIVLRDGRFQFQEGFFVLKMVTVRQGYFVKQLPPPP